MWALRSKRNALSITALAVLAFAGCKSSQSGAYAGAATTLGLGVAATGIYRATTGGCVGQCTHGRVCDRESGTCVLPEERAEPELPRLERVDCLPEEPGCVDGRLPGADAGVGGPAAQTEAGTATDADAETDAGLAPTPRRH